jgi:hypothetical protein
MLDGIPASVDDLMNIKGELSGTHVSVFSEQEGTRHEIVAVDPHTATPSHLNASIELSMLFECIRC